jgi:hypothetical protein
MANSVTVTYQKSGENFKTTVFTIGLSGNYAAPEVVTLTAAAALNPAAVTVTGPNGTTTIPPRVTALQLAGNAANGYVGKLYPTGTAGQYNLTFAYGATAFAGAYTAGDFAVIEVDHNIQA